jgi:hypothetical protein
VFSLFDFFKKKEPDNTVDFMPSDEGMTVTMLGRYANSVLKNPAIDEAFKRAEHEIFNAWKTSPPKEEVAREHLYYRMEGLSLIRLHLKKMVNAMLIEENKQKKKKAIND